jgi:hypothetical protein
MIVVLCAVSAALLGGFAIAYARFVWTHGNGFRRYMRWLAPLWAAVAYWHALIWTLAAFDPTLRTPPLLRPVAWLAYAIPALTLFNALREDTRHKAEYNHDSTLVEAKRQEIEHG